MQLNMIKGYPYARMDFHGDPNLAIPDGERWGAIGKKKHFDHFFFIFKFYNLFCIFYVSQTNYRFLHADVGIIRPVNSSYLQHVGDPQQEPNGVHVATGGTRGIAGS